MAAGNYNFAAVLRVLSEETVTPVCLDCSYEAARFYGFCPKCYKRLPIVKAPLCPKCGAENDGIFDICRKCLKENERPWEKGFSVMRMERHAKELIHRFKYGGETALARAFGRMIAEKLMNFRKEYSCIVPVPMHWSRRISRGYNQTELVARITAKQLGLPLVNALKRTKRTPKQAALDRKARLTNIAGAFSPQNGIDFGSGRVLLIDDVMTTGTTLSEAAGTLRSAGAEEVDTVVVCRA